MRALATGRAVAAANLTASAWREAVAEGWWWPAAERRTGGKT